jgi:hypothetical protein
VLVMVDDDTPEEQEDDQMKLTCCLLSLLARFVSWCVFLDREVEAIHRNKKKKERERRKGIGGSTRKHSRRTLRTAQSTTHRHPSVQSPIKAQSKIQ